MTEKAVTDLRTRQIITGLRSIATEMDIFTEGPHEGDQSVVVLVRTLKDWIGDIRVCADDLEADMKTGGEKTDDD